MFHGLSYTKSTHEIKEKAIAKIEKLKAKITEREQRLVNLRKEYDIDDKALIELLTAARKAQKQGLGNMQYTYKSSMSNQRIGASASAGLDSDKTEEADRVIGAGVVNHLLTENDFIESEKESIKELEFIAKHLKPLVEYQNGIKLPEQEWTLSKEELKFLEF